MGLASVEAVREVRGIVVGAGGERRPRSRLSPGLSSLRICVGAGMTFMVIDWYSCTFPELIEKINIVRIHEARSDPTSRRQPVRAQLL